MPKVPDIPMFQGISATRRIEMQIHDLEVEGEIPSGLDGAFCGVAPDRQCPPRFPGDAPFNADGLIAIIKLPIRLRPGYHGSWASEARIKGHA